MTNTPQPPLPAPSSDRVKHIEAAQVEATGIARIDVEYKGNVYSFPADPEDAPYETMEALDEGHFSLALRQLLSKADYAKFKASRPTVRDASDLWDAYAHTAGFENAGE